MAAIVMLSFGRSGGTVLNQCLGCLPDTVCLSEVNPVACSYASVKQQAKDWYDIDIRSDDFAEGILELDRACEDRGLHLIVRDWSYVNFVPRKWNRGNVANRLLILDVLAGKTELIPFAFVRDVIDVWISFLKHNARAALAPEEFCAYYLTYVREILNRGVTTFRYEDFCREPDTTLRQICDYTGLEHSQSYRRYAEFSTVYGDMASPTSSRGIRQGKIAPLPRWALSPERVVQLNESLSMVEANRLLGYSTSYGEAQ